jgi:CxxC-x17-CxxC domain-containing protein
VAYADKTINCIDCGRPFIFSARDQEFYAQNGFTNEPKRCPECRRQRKASRGDAGMGGGGGYGGPRESRGPRQLYPATCSNCGRETEVPFQPRGDRPVYCRDCFRDRQPVR